MTALDREIQEFREQGRIALDYKDIQARYGVGIVNARDIIRGIKSVCGGGKLPSGKVLPSEVEYWESLVDKRKIRM